METKIYLYGPSGSGKTTIGRQLATDLDLPFWDMDEEIEARSGFSIPEIFAAQGESGFRTREHDLLAEVVSRRPGVVSLGGGALLDAENRARVEASGAVVCLTAPFETLLARLQFGGSAQDRSASNQRPLLSGDQATLLKQLLERRATHYASFPLQLDSGDLTPQQAAWELQVRLGRYHVRGMSAAAWGGGYDVRVLRGGLGAACMPTVAAALEGRGFEGSLMLVSDEIVGKLYAPEVAESFGTAHARFESFFIPSGERHKTLETVQQLWQAFLRAGVERGSTILALGGGVVGDLAGFAAATFLRGVRWVALPTTLLAMVDASLGGKTGIDLPQGKNLVGAFHPPGLVLADPATLDTLPEAELRSGLAEVVKHGVIGDAQLFRLCASGWEALQADWTRVVRRAMGVKVRVVQADPFEKGVRATLNFGHTVGHALERVSGFRLRHGEAVAIGMVVEARLAERMGLAQSGLADSLAEVLHALGLPVETPAALPRQAVIEAMQVDKKRREGRLRFALPRRIGEVTVTEVDELEAIFQIE